ncbi:MAG TPA: hypothetical protein DCE07_04480 [Peptococcaceae bacterium]|nr:hypothetical protein [Peptococcaceae bacterium]
MAVSSSDLVSGKVVQDLHPGLEVAGVEAIPIPSAGSFPGCREDGGRIQVMPGVRLLEVLPFPMKWSF